MTPQDMFRIRAIIDQCWPNSGAISDAEFEVWSDAIGQYTYTDVAAALKRLIATETFRPRVVALAEQLYAGPSASAVLQETLEAVRRYGYPNEVGAMAALSPEAKDAIDYFGGWHYWCTTTNQNYREKMATICERVVKRRARETDLGIGPGSGWDDEPLELGRLDG